MRCPPLASFPVVRKNPGPPCTGSDTPPVKWVWRVVAMRRSVGVERRVVGRWDWTEMRGRRRARRSVITAGRCIIK
jgi:hypothetical protein